MRAVAPVWGYVVIANTMLFARGKFRANAGVIYSPDPHFDDAVFDLKSVAIAMFTAREQLAAGDLSPEVRRTAEVFADESGSPKGHRIAPELTEGREVYYELLRVERDCLPDAYLADQMLPILPPASVGEAAEVLPLKHWPRPLVRRWHDLAVTAAPETMPNVGGVDIAPVDHEKYASDPITLTPAAAASVRQYASDTNLDPFYVRVGAVPDGGGFLYELDLHEGDPPPDECVSQASEGLQVATPASTAALLLGTVVDWHEGGGGFVFHNPNTTPR